MPDVAGYVQVGGLRWGGTLWSGANATWPLARVSVSAEHIELALRWRPLGNVRFKFRRSDLRAIRRIRVLFSPGVVFEHQKSRLSRVHRVLDVQAQSSL
jgi:hypothetical protein